MKASKETTADSFHICPKYDKAGSGKQVYRYTECRKVITENIPFLSNGIRTRSLVL